MIDYDILDACGTTQKRLQEIFTAVPYDSNDDSITEDQRKAREKDVERRKTFEERIRDRQNEGIMWSMSNYPIFSSADLAWDSRPIHPHTYSLMMYAEGRIDVGACAKQLTDLQCADQFVTKDATGKLGINMPKFTDVTVNLVSSFITRRLAAQSNKTQSLWPYYKYESRSTSPVGKLRADVMSQVADIMADAYDHRHHDVQVMRDMMLYSTSVDFVRRGWEREVQWEKEPVSEEFQGKEIKKRTTIVKEGVSFVNPHPCRVYYDNAYPLCSINTDTGCEFIGYWDVIRAKDVINNPEYWNRTNITYDSMLVGLFSNFSPYFSQYYCTIKVPAMTADMAANNDRKNGVGYMAANELDSAMVIGVYHEKLKPKDYGIGDYPYEVWVRFMTAGADGTVIHAEILPSTPAAVMQFNCKDDRRLNKSIAHELMGYQDQLTNLLNYLLLCLSTDNFKVIVMDTDTLSPESLAAFRAKAQGKNYYNEPLVLEISRSKLETLGIDVAKVVTMIETRNSAAIDVIFRAMLQLLQMVERLMALSPQEQGQPAPREISATETNLIAGTTESVYGFISDSVDEKRAAVKRIIYESFISCGNNDLSVPAINRYSASVIKAAGFEVLPDEMELPNDPAAPQRHTIVGSKTRLQHDYIFTTRDGAERSVNTQSANVLVQLLGVMQDPLVKTAAGKEKYFEIINEIFRLSGAGVDLKLDVREGESDSFGPDQMAQIQQVLQQITAQLEAQQKAMQQQGQAVQQLGQQVEQLNQSGQELTKALAQDQKEFKQAIGETITNLEHKQQIQNIKTDGQIRKLMSEVIQLGRLEKQAA